MKSRLVMPLLSLMSPLVYTCPHETANGYFLNLITNFFLCYNQPEESSSIRELRTQVLVGGVWTKGTPAGENTDSEMNGALCSVRNRTTACPDDASGPQGFWFGK